MSGGLALYCLALYSALLSLFLSIEQVFFEPIATINYMYSECMLWAITFICIGIGLVIDCAGDEECKKL